MREFRATLGLCLVFAFASAMLAGCTVSGNSGRSAIHSAATIAASAADMAGAKAPAPLEATAIDEKALTIAAKAVAVAAKSCSALVAAGIITPGSALALSLRRLLLQARDGVLAAAEARAAGSATSYREALDRAEAAADAILALITPFGDRPHV